MLKKMSPSESRIEMHEMEITEPLFPSSLNIQIWQDLIRRHFTLSEWMTLESVCVVHRILNSMANNGGLVEAQCNNWEWQNHKRMAIIVTEKWFSIQHSDKNNVEPPGRVPSDRVAKASTYWMTKDYKTCIDLVDSIAQVPCIMQSDFLVLHNNLVCHQVERPH